VKVTIELSDQAAEQLRQEAAQLGGSIESLVWWYMRFGMEQWQAHQQEGARAAAALREAHSDAERQIRTYDTRYGDL